MRLLFVEVDNCHESAEELAGKLEKYARFFRRQVKDTDGKERAMWRTRWPVPDGRWGTCRIRRCCWSSTGSATATRTAPSRAWPT
ncbi:hypothetical protein PV350_36110 [Streptomyces sp. PA03-6a]|nr:hypothetical protein [Streptomyces sp. PA03-6a]